MPKPEKRSIVFKDALGGDTSEITPHRPQGITVADPDDVRLKSAEKMILIALCRYADDSGLSAPPSHRIISQCCGMTEYWARETLKALEARGYIKTVDDARRARKYQLLIWPQE